MARIAVPVADHPQLIVLDGELLEDAQRGLGQRQIDFLASLDRVAEASAQCREDSYGAEQAADGISERVSGMHRCLVSLAGQIGQATHGLEQARESRSRRVGSVLPEARGTQDRQCRIRCP